MSSLKSKLAVGFLAFAITAFAILGLIAWGVVVDTAICATVLFLFNAAFHWCGGWMYLGLWKTLSYGFAASLVIRGFKLVRWVTARG